MARPAQHHLIGGHVIPMIVIYVVQLKRSVGRAAPSARPALGGDQLGATLLQSPAGDPPRGCWPGSVGAAASAP